MPLVRCGRRHAVLVDNEGVAHAAGCVALAGVERRRRAARWTRVETLAALRIVDVACASTFTVYTDGRFVSRRSFVRSLLIDDDERRL